MLIHPEIIVAPDRPTVKFREPREQVNLEAEIPKILHVQGWGVGTYFNVQFISHDRTKLLSAALFVVTQETEGLHTSDHPYQPVTKVIYTRKASLVGGWWEGEKTSRNATVTWNPGKKLHQVKEGGEVIYETADKELAHQVANGETPNAP
jgi:hypothetical protein